MPPLHKKRQVRRYVQLGTRNGVSLRWPLDRGWDLRGPRVLGAKLKVFDADPVAQEAAAVTQELQVDLLPPLSKRDAIWFDRQLCIYKGIHPRVPKRTRRDHRIFYHNKDIKFMAHEPSIVVLRKQRQFLRKIRAAQRRRDRPEMKRLEMKFPKLGLSHILKERYPTFQHALRDLDDPLTMAHLFANLHQQEQFRDAPELHEAAARLCAEFQAYVIKTHSLRKVFISVKGYYYQADIMGTLVTWCVPHKFMQNFDTKQIDPFIMTCYMEFYKTMLGFVNFRLFHSIGMCYPPDLAADEDTVTEALEALPSEEQREKATNQLAAPLSEKDRIDEDEELVEIEEDAEIGEKAAGETAHVPAHDDRTLCAKLFEGLTFFLGRETPVDQLMFVIRAFGGTVAWEGEDSSFNVRDARITHCICDRGSVKDEMKAPGREYVQPQWIFDCCNARVLLPTERYAIGVSCPPHLSPFVSSEEEGYVPDYAKEIQRIQEAANLVRQTNDISAQEQALEEVLADDVTFQEEDELEKVKKQEEAYLGELELELETEFPMEISKEKVSEEAKKHREAEVLKEKEKMDEIMVTKRYQYKRLKRKEIAKKAKVEKLKRKRAQLAQTE